MKSLKQQLNEAVGASLARVAQLESCNPNVITASKPEFGDYQANGVMAVAKQLGRNPREIAQAVVDELESLTLPQIARLEVAGPGFINIHLDNDYLCRSASEALQDGSLLQESDQQLKIAVDYSSPNLAKEMHVGHLRGTIIGDCLVRVLEALGHNVVRQNHVGDWGTQFGMLITYMEELATDNNSDSSAALSGKLADLETFYKEAKARFDNDETFATAARLSVVRLQSGDGASVAAWEQFIDESLRHCEDIYQKLDVTLTREHLDAESRYNDDLPKIVEELEQKGLLTDSEGARCVFMDEFVGKDGTPLPLIVQKSDGGYLYATTDLAAVRLRVQDQVDRSLYVVDVRQSLHFQQVFAVAEAAGFTCDRIELEHIAYGTIMGKDGRPYKTRSGDTVKLAELLDEGIRRAYDLVKEKNPDLEEEEHQLIAQRVGIGAVKYADLSKNRTSDYVFDWDTMLSFEGNTAPYMLYAYARIRSILRKSEEQLGATITVLENDEERMLLIKLLQLQETIDAVALDCFPNQLCNYLYELAGLFMRFYEACPILKAEPDTRASRLALADLSARTLQQGLHLLGIETLETM